MLQLDVLHFTDSACSRGRAKAMWSCCTDHPQVRCILAAFRSKSLFVRPWLHGIRVTHKVRGVLRYFYCSSERSRHILSMISRTNWAKEETRLRQITRSLASPVQAISIMCLAIRARSTRSRALINLELVVSETVRAPQSRTSTPIDLLGYLRGVCVMGVLRSAKAHFECV